MVFPFYICGDCCDDCSRICVRKDQDGGVLPKQHICVCSDLSQWVHPRTIQRRAVKEHYCACSQHPSECIRGLLERRAFQSWSDLSVLQKLHSWTDPSFFCVREKLHSLTLPSLGRPHGVSHTESSEFIDSFVESMSILVIWGIHPVAWFSQVQSNIVWRSEWKVWLFLHFFRTRMKYLTLFKRMQRVFPVNETLGTKIVQWSEFSDVWIHSVPNVRQHEFGVTESQDDTMFNVMAMFFSGRNTVMLCSIQR